MSRSERTRVLAIGIDAAEASFVRQLLDGGKLPALRALAAEGVWGRVTSPAPIASAAVWPSFLTGLPPAEHGLYGEWTWQPDTMDLGRPTWDHLDPFWRAAAKEGRKVVVLDVPFAPRVDVPGCVEVLDWGAHDYLNGRLEVSPPSLEPIVRAVGGNHPFAAGHRDTTDPRDRAALARVARWCLDGIQQRGRLARRLLADVEPDLMVLVFTELHRAGHRLWHTVDPEHPDHDVAATGKLAGPGLIELLQAIDREIGHLRDQAGPDTAIVVFALHGMRSARGIPALLASVLEAGGFAVRKSWHDQSRSERVQSALSAVKRIVPDPTKRLYRRWTPAQVVSQLTQPSMPIPAYDWARTSAFALPTDQHGWVRVNLRGREALGSVEPDQYEAVCQRVEEALRAATRVDGQSIVRAIVRTAQDSGPPKLLPDLVVHWTDATFAWPLRLATLGVTAAPVGRRYTGQHAFRGFYLHRPARNQPPVDGATIATEHLHRLLAPQDG